MKGLVLGFLAWLVFLAGSLFTAGDNGVEVFAVLALSPFGFGPLVWIVVGGCLSDVELLRYRATASLLLIFHYGFLVYYFNGPVDGGVFSELAKAIKRFPVASIMWGGYYIACNCFCWKRIFRYRLRG